ncbi:acyl-coenzyme A thioesterase 9, mitochondrial isoform X1 [Drosophila santomea]|uniref:acyl-coenzyme A thioesterase 9, mitochondrial isoform X1 n=1 Tax=Drosophila santomea TaxID=129105 RepID=UPI0019549DEA|nr:acyl-coenzyme A thioesterase 9, mitochondrial isoform X1 [Drosophila santomea]
MNLSQHLGRRVIAVRHLCPQLGALRHRFAERGGDQLESGHSSGTMADVAKKIREHVGVEAGYHIIPKSREGLLKFQPKQDELPNRSMVDSYTTAKVLLETDAVMRQRFVYGRGLLRMGRIIEELDLLAVWICHLHIHLPNLPEGVPLPYTFITLLVDHAHFLQEEFIADADVSLSGHVSWTDKSSMEVTAYVRQNGMLLAKGIFVVEARNAVNNGPAPVNPLVPATKLEESLYQEAQKRRANATTRLESQQPTKEEQQLMYELFTRTKGADGPSPSDMSTLPPNSRWMSKWRRRTLVHPFPENRNESNTIFGGFIIRKAIEISYMTVSLYTNQRCMIRSIADVTFTHSIPVHSYIKLKAYVVFTHKNFIQLLTVVNAIGSNSFEERRCNVLHLTYSCSNVVPEILPRSYHEALWYLTGRRYFNRFRDSVSHDIVNEAKRGIK